MDACPRPLGPRRARTFGRLPSQADNYPHRVGRYSTIRPCLRRLRDSPPVGSDQAKKGAGRVRKRLHALHSLQPSRCHDHNIQPVQPAVPCPFVHGVKESRSNPTRKRFHTHQGRLHGTDTRPSGSTVVPRQKLALCDARAIVIGRQPPRGHRVFAVDVLGRYGMLAGHAWRRDVLAGPHVDCLGCSMALLAMARGRPVGARRGWDLHHCGVCVGGRGVRRRVGPRLRR